MTFVKQPFISAPWQGWDDSAPSLLLDPKSFKQITGWLINKGRLQGFPNTPAFTGPPNGMPILGADTFMDSLGFLHTGVITNGQAYYLNGSGYLAQGAPSSTSNQVYSLEVFQNRLFFANGSGVLQYLDGSQGIQNTTNSPGTCKFLAKLASRLFQLNLFESGQDLPLSFRFSAVNNALQWDATVDPSAGVGVIPEVEDEISGAAVTQNTVVVYRKAGVSLIQATGSIPQFNVFNYGSGPTGVGVYYVYTLGTYGGVSVFVAEDDVYVFDLSSLTPIGGKSKKSIFADLFSASDRPWACFVGNLGNGIEYRSYWLSIPQSNNTLSSVWVFHFDDQTWVNEQLPYGAIRWMGNIAVS